MKKLTGVLGITLLFATAAYAGTYSSSFGFSADIPSDWTVLSQKELADNPDLFNVNDPRFKDMDPGLMQQVLANIRSGGMEIYYHTGFGDAGFRDNVNVTKSPGKVPTTAADLKQACDEMPGAFSKYFGHPISFYQCALAKIDGKDAMLLEFDGALQGTRSIQYQVQKSENAVLVVTGTFTETSLASEREPFTHIATSMKLQ